MYRLLFILIFSSFWLLDNISKRDSIFSVLPKINNIHHKIDTTVIFYDVYKFEVTSKYIYSKKQDSPLYLSQEVKIEKSNIVIYRKDHITNLKSVNFLDFSVNCLENFISHIGVIITKQKEPLFVFTGWGGNNYGIFYYIIIDHKDEIQYKLYWDEKKEIVFSKFGKFEDALLNDDSLIKKYLHEDYDIKKYICQNCTFTF